MGRCSLQQTDFSVWGFRLSHVIINFLGQGIRFSVLLIAFGWAAGAATIALSFLFSPPGLVTYVGFGVVARWLGRMIVGSVLPLVIWRAGGRTWRVGDTLDPNARAMKSEKQSLWQARYSDQCGEPEHVRYRPRPLLRRLAYWVLDAR